MYFLAAAEVHLFNFSGIFLSELSPSVTSSCCRFWSVLASLTGFFSLVSSQKWFKWRNAYWRKAEGLPAEAGSVLD
uniref:Uncharacterized protein n=1 Tax=Oryzias sinensis TaxID=183150 RepID=A0A8C7WXR8_9TELE